MSQESINHGVHLHDHGHNEPQRLPVLPASVLQDCGIDINYDLSPQDDPGLHGFEVIAPASAPCFAADRRSAIHHGTYGCVLFCIVFALVHVALRCRHIFISKRCRSSEKHRTLCVRFENYCSHMYTRVMGLQRAVVSTRLRCCCSRDTSRNKITTIGTRRRRLYYHTQLHSATHNVVVSKEQHAGCHDHSNSMVECWKVQSISSVRHTWSNRLRCPLAVWLQSTHRGLLLRRLR